VSGRYRHDPERVTEAHTHLGRATKAVTALVLDMHAARLSLEERRPLAELAESLRLAVESLESLIPDPNDLDA